MLWSLDNSPGFRRLDERWKDVLSWERSTRKKQVNNDAKLVLATRICLEQGELRKKPPSANLKISPEQCLSHFEPIYVWSVMVLAEYFHCLLISHAVSCYIHRLLCPHECNNDGSPSKSGTQILPEQLIVNEMIRTPRESSGFAKRILVHCHKYQISKIVPKQYSPENEDIDSISSEHSTSDGDIITSQLQFTNSSSWKSSLPTSLSSPTNTETHRDRREQNASLSISDVRSPPEPIPIADYPFHLSQLYPSPSDYEPQEVRSTRVDRISAHQRSRSLDSNPARKRSSTSTKDSSDKFLETSSFHRSASSVSATPIRDDLIESRPLVAFGRSSSPSSLNSKRQSTPDNYLLSSSSLRSLENKSPRTSLDSTLA